ncbi:MAG: PadR family transcriptional regulator [Acholeplasmatales bacterium]|nr:MAG: PadR family transcriptional regulator [Acholeplasmatales bacterium]
MSSDLIRGHLELVVLKLIIEKDHYGYELANAVANRTNQAFSINEATLYAIMQRLEKRGLIQSYVGTKSHGGKRRYYTITPLGLAYYETKLKEWELLKTIMTQLLEGGHEDD